MFDLNKIMDWFDANFQLVRRSRRKTLAAIVAGGDENARHGSPGVGSRHGRGNCGKVLY